MYLKLQQKNYIKVYHIIYSLRKYTHVESNQICFSILWFFCDLLWFFKNSVKINIKKGIKTAAMWASNRSERLCELFRESKESTWMISLSREKKQIRTKVLGERKKDLFLVITCVEAGPHNGLMLEPTWHACCPVPWSMACCISSSAVLRCILGSVR